jgi:putative alpha-1,2-mannosidase
MLTSVYLLSAQFFASSAYALNGAQYVNLFIGTQGTTPGTSYNGGNVFPGPSRPWGAVKVGIDTTVYGASSM